MLKVYKASAGSGKTYRLALQYITLALAEGDPYAFRHILAVTFTNKATGEMKDRILSHLYGLAHGTGDEGFLHDTLAALPAIDEATLRARAQRSLEAILHDFDHFYVTTIDSFFQSVLQNLGHELGLARGFRVELGDKEVIGEAVDNLLRHTGTPRPKPLHDNAKTADREGHNAELLSRIARYVEVHTGNEKGWNISKELKQFAVSNLVNNKTYHGLEALIEDFVNTPNAVSDLACELRQLRDDAEAMLNDGVRALAEAVDALPFGCERFSQGRYIAGYLHRLLTATDLDKPASATLCKYMANPEAMLKKADSGNADLAAHARVLAEALAKAEEARVAAVSLLNTIDLATECLSPLTLLGAVSRTVGRLNEENGRFMLSKTTELLDRMVGNGDASFVFERVGTTFRHVMIDEFQDTSYSQWSNFRHILIENLAAGDECVLVGDVKQSIYRWRGGDWSILEHEVPSISGTRVLNTKGQDLLAPRGDNDPKPQDTNYRSCERIVHFNNAFFKAEAAHADRLIDDDKAGVRGAEPSTIVQRIYADVEQGVRAGRKGGYVAVRLFPPRSVTEEEVMEAVVTEMKRLHRDYAIPYGKMGLLVRSNREASALIDYVSKAHPDVKMASDEAFRLNASPAVRLLMAAMKLTVRPDDCLMQAVVRREADLLKTDPLIEQIEAEAKSLRSLPLYELYGKLIEMYGLSCDRAQTVQGKQQAAYLFTLGDYMTEYLKVHSSNPEHFCTYYDETLSKKSAGVLLDEDTAYVCTIHKAKGLEFHTVLMPFADWNFFQRREDDRLWCTAPPRLTPLNRLPAYPIKTYTTSKVKASLFSESLYEENAATIIDNINALYVAFTRASHHLLIWSRTKNVKTTATDIVAHGVEAIGMNCTPENTDEVECSLYEDGEPMRYQPKTEQRDDSNPFSPLARATNPEEEAGSDTAHLTWDERMVAGLPLPVDMHPKAERVEFRQSTEAVDFMTRLTEEAAAATDATTEAFPEHAPEITPRMKGLVYHDVLSRLRTADDLPTAIEAVAVEGGFASEAEKEEATSFLADRLTNAQVAEWFDSRAAILYNECQLLSRSPEGTLTVHRPDRVVRHNGRTLVIDYKFGAPHHSHHTQVAGYMRLLHRMGAPNVKGYLWYVSQNRIIEVDDTQKP